MEVFEDKYHPWMVFDAWKLKIAYISSSWVDLLNSRFHKVEFHANFAFLT